MDAERWRRIEDVFNQIVEVSDSERTALMDQLCANDADLRKEVESLLQGEESGDGFIQTAIGDVAKSYATRQKHELEGKQTGPYNILRKIYSGGMGSVYLAQDTDSNRKVAIKVLPQILARHPDHVRRFQREIRSLAVLSHPNIISVFDAGEVEGCPFMVMEYVEGITLRDKIREGPLPLEQIIPITIQIAYALSEAHRRGIIHRDITTKNVMITSENTAKILDFGVAKAMSSSGLNSGTLTKSGIVVGTVQFMSPEQATGKQIDHRSDLFSTGIVLYEVTTGHLPFRGKTIMETISAIAQHDPANGLNECHPDFRKIILKCLEKDKSHRYANAHQLSSDLCALSRRLNIPIPRSDNRTRRLARWLANKFPTTRSFE